MTAARTEGLIPSAAKPTVSWVMEFASNASANTHEPKLRMPCTDLLGHPGSLVGEDLRERVMIMNVTSRTSEGRTYSGSGASWNCLPERGRMIDRRALYRKRLRFAPAFWLLHTTFYVSNAPGSPWAASDRLLFKHSHCIAGASAGSD